MKRILFVFGTRPEAIKLAPLIKTFGAHISFVVKVCVTAQHREMLDQALGFFDIVPDYDLNLMQANQTLLQITARALESLEPVINDAKPDLIFVQGDTTTVLVGALASYYKNIKVAHIEAGLRSFDKYSPFPEEMNRLLISRLADFHFTPTQGALENLLEEGIKTNVYNVGNTVIDALQLGLSIIQKDENTYSTFFKNIDFSKKIILVTCHRRESFGKPFQDICKALLRIATENEDVELVYPVHLNPNIQDIAKKLLVHPRIKLISPLDYPYFIWLMNKSYLVLTDSGGIQEEAPSLGKPVLVLRNVTERTEGIAAGTAKLVGTDPEIIFSETWTLLKNANEYARMSKATNPYGDGTSTDKILGILMDDIFRGE